jgi:hypothetical protein
MHTESHFNMISLRKIKALSSNGQYEAAASIIYDSLENQFYKDEGASFTTPQRLFFAVAVFVGQMRDGGLISVLSPPWNVITPLAKEGFEAIGQTEYADIAGEIFTILSSNGYKVEEVGRDLGDFNVYNLDSIEQPFWDYYYRQEDPDIANIDKALVHYYLKSQWSQL